MATKSAPVTEKSPLLSLDANKTASVTSTTSSSTSFVSTTHVNRTASTATVTQKGSAVPPTFSLSLFIGNWSSMAAAVNPVDADLPITNTVRKNPFTYTSRIDCYERFKMIVVCLLGIPILRLTLILSAAIMCGLLCSLAMIGYSPVDPKTNRRQPLVTWRQLLLVPRPYLIRVVLFGLGYHWINVKLPEGGLDHKNLPRIVVSNHVGFIDGPFLAYYLNASIAMKAELGSIPVLGKIIQSMQPILIDRNTSNGRKQAIQDIANHLADPVYPPLLIFPEGTTSNQEFLTKFKVGSFSSGLPCLPVTLKYPFKHFDVSWTPDVSALYLLGRTLCQVHNRLDVEFLSPYTPTEAEGEQPELYAEGVRQLMAQSLNVATTNHAFEDVSLLLKVGKYADQHVVPITDVGEVSTLTALRSSDVHHLVQYFIKKDLNSDGEISLEEMKTLFPNDDSMLLEHLFALLDMDGSGAIDFRELCIGLTALNPGRDSSEVLKFAFRVYDLDANGVLDRSELDKMLAFFRSFYGVDANVGADQLNQPPPIDLEAELRVDNFGQVSFENFSQFMTKHPHFLGHVKSKLQVLRGSFRASDAVHA